jgi:hypothetical protein
VHTTWSLDADFLPSQAAAHAIRLTNRLFPGLCVTKLFPAPPPLAMAAERSSSPVGARRRVGDYLLGQTLGAGSFGKVKLATHVTTGEKVCVPRAAPLAVVLFDRSLCVL